MPDNPISGVSPTEPASPYGQDKPRLGAGEETQEPKPFTIGPEGGKASPSEATPERPSPMEVAGDAARQHPQIAPTELSENIVELQKKLNNIQDKIQDPRFQQKFTDDHFEGMRKVTQKMNPDMQAIAKNSGGQYTPPQQQKGQGVLEHISDWINGSQGTLGNALSYLQTENPQSDPSSYLKLQYAVQRATQRGELFASIVGSSVSGIKTIMSTQLG